MTSTAKIVIRRPVLALVLALVVSTPAACRNDNDDDSTTVAGSTVSAATATVAGTPARPPTAVMTSTSASTSTSTQAPTPGPELPDAVEAVAAQAAEDAGVERDQVLVLHYEPREWPTSALGCPQPGMFYAQVITPGYLVQLQIGDDEREYHTDRSGNAVLCE